MPFGDRDQNRGMFGYEGEGYMHGGERGRFDRDAWRSDADRGHFAGYERARDDSDRRDPMPSFRGRGPRNYKRSDERVREEICDRLTEDHYVDATEVEVNVAEGIVTLSGMVSDRGQKRRAEDVVESVNGVREVQNNLRIQRT